MVYAQSPGEVARTGELLGLTATEAELVTELRQGTALWKVGRRSFLVEHRLASGERWLTDTDQAMTEPADPRSGGDRTWRRCAPVPVSAPSVAMELGSMVLGWAAVAVAALAPGAPGRPAERAATRVPGRSREAASPRRAHGGPGPVTSAS